MLIPNAMRMIAMQTFLYRIFYILHFISLISVRLIYKKLKNNNKPVNDTHKTRRSK